MGAPQVSVILPVLNEAKDLGTLLEQLQAQGPPEEGFEVLVVDGGSTDATREIVDRARAHWPAVRLLDNPARRSSPARNVGARAASGRFLLYIDGHCSIPRNDYLRRVAELFESSGADCLCRPQPLGDLARGRWGQAIALARHSRLGHDPGSDIYGGSAGFTDPRSAGAAYRREVFGRLGGFDERFDACEDVEFNHRVDLAGFRAYRHPDLAVAYRPRETLRAFLRQMFRYGRGRGRLWVRHPQLFPRFLVFAALLGAMTIGCLVVPGGRLGVTLCAAALGAWILICGIEGVRLGGLTPRGIRTAVALATVHLGLTLGFCRGVLDFRKFRPPLTEGEPGREPQGVLS